MFRGELGIIRKVSTATNHSTPVAQVVSSESLRCSAMRVASPRRSSNSRTRISPASDVTLFLEGTYLTVLTRVNGRALRWGAFLLTRVPALVFLSYSGCTHCCRKHEE